MRRLRGLPFVIGALIVVGAGATGSSAAASVSSEVGTSPDRTYMSCGEPPTFSLGKRHKGSLDYRSQPSSCYYTSDGTAVDLIILKQIRWEGWGEPIARATAKRVDSHDQDRNGFERHPVTVVVRDLRPALNGGDMTLFYTTMEVVLEDGQPHVWRLFRPGQEAIGTPDTERPRPPVRRTCGPLLPEGMGAYSYIRTWGIRCAPAQRAAHRARRKFCKHHNDCTVDPMISISQIYKGTIRYRGWACHVKVGWELTVVRCDRRQMRFIQKSAA